MSGVLVRRGKTQRPREETREGQRGQRETRWHGHKPEDAGGHQKLDQAGRTLPGASGESIALQTPRFQTSGLQTRREEGIIEMGLEADTGSSLLRSLCYGGSSLCQGRKDCGT